VLARVRRRGLVATPSSLDAVATARADLTAAEERVRAALHQLAAGVHETGSSET
jgi:hypothetical protein